jgi:hypothetical protein
VQTGHFTGPRLVPRADVPVAIASASVSSPLASTFESGPMDEGRPEEDPMAEIDRYVRGIQDLLGQLGTPAERLRAMEEVIGRFPVADTRRAAGEFVHDLAGTPERLLEVRRLLSEFASPAEQLRAFEQQVALTRQQLELVAQQLAGIESTIGTFAGLAEQLSALQEPFTNLTSSWRGDPKAAAGAADDAGAGEGDAGPATP